MSDRLDLAHALEEGGMPRQAAEKVATEIYEAIHDNVATKADLVRVQAALKTDITAVRSELAVAVRDLKIWTGSIIVAAAGLLFAALHYWPPHG